MDIHQSQADVILRQDLGHQILHLHLDILLAGGQHGIHAGGAHHVAHLALDEVAQDQLRRGGGIQVLFRVGDLVLHIEVHINNIVVAGDHGGFAGIFVAAVVGNVAQLDLLVHIHIHLLHLLDAEGELEVDTGVGDVGDLAEGGYHRLLPVIHGVEAGCTRHHGDENQQSNKDAPAGLFGVKFFSAFLRGLVGSPAVGSVLHD